MVSTVEIYEQVHHGSNCYLQNDVALDSKVKQSISLYGGPVQLVTFPNILQWFIEGVGRIFDSFRNTLLAILSLSFFCRPSFLRFLIFVELTEA